MQNNIINQIVNLLETNKNTSYQLQELLSNYQHQVKTTDNDYYNNTSHKIGAELDQIKNKINNLIIGYESIYKSIGLVEALEKVLEAMDEPVIEEEKKPMSRIYNPSRVVIPPREKEVIEEPKLIEPEKDIDNLSNNTNQPTHFLDGERIAKKIGTDKPRVVMSLESTYGKYYDSEKRKRRLANMLLRFGQRKQSINNEFNINDFNN